MAPFGGGAPAGHGASPPPPPPPASSSSTLSPLAPPFTAWAPPSSRRFAADPDQNRPLPWSSPSPSPSAPAAAAPTRWSVFDAPGASYYPRYSPSVGGMSADAVFQPLHQQEGHGGLGAGKWGAPFDSGDARQAGGSDGVSSWMEPSYDYKAPCFQEGGAAYDLIPFENASGVWHGKHVSSFTRKADFGPECSEWLNDRIPEIYGENAISSYNIFGESVLTPSALSKGMSSQLPGFNSKFSLTSSYDGYMGYPPKTCSTSAQVHASSSRRTDPSADSSMLTNGYSMVQPVDSYRIRADHENHISTNPKKLDINQNADVKVDYGEMTWANYVKTQTSIAADPFSLKAGLRSGDELANGNSIDSSTDVDSGLKLKPLNLPSAYTSECGPAEIDDSVGDSSQTFDQLNLAVDSPCWKGAPVPKQSPFGAAETAHLHPALKECKHSDELDQGQTILPLNLANSVTVFPLAHVGTLICDGKKKASSVSSLMESPVIPPSIQQNLDEASKAKDDNKKGIHSSDSCKEQSNGVRKHQNRDSEALDNEVMQLASKETAVYANECITGDGVANLEMGIKAKVRGHLSDVNPGKPSSSGNDIQLLVQTLYSLSEVLLSSYYYDTKELKEHDHKLLKLVIHNLEAFTVKNKKVMASGRFEDSGVEAPGFWDTGLKADAVTNLVNNKNADDIKGKLHSTESSMNNVIKGGISKVNGLAQTFEKVLEKTLFEPEESPQAQVYKTLWIEAEAALCSLKYESQLTRMKIDMENFKHQITDFSGRSPQMAGLSSLNSIHDLDGHDTPMKPKESSNDNTMPHLGGAGTSSYRKPHETPRSNANRKEEIDSSILARLKVLKGRRIEESDPMSVEPQMLLGSVDFGPYNEVNDPIYRSEGGSEAGSEHLPAKLADLGFMESIPLTNTNEDTRNKDKIKAGFQYPTTRESHGTTVKMPATIKPYTPTGQRKRLLAGGHSSPSSEWEHVLKEDFTLQ